MVVYIHTTRAGARDSSYPKKIQWRLLKRERVVSFQCHSLAFRTFLRLCLARLKDKLALMA